MDSDNLGKFNKDNESFNSKSYSRNKISENIIFILSILVRLVLIHSKIVKKISSIFIFSNSQIYDSNSIISSNYLIMNFKHSNYKDFLLSSNSSITRLFNSVFRSKSENFIIFFLSLIDIINSKMISRLISKKSLSNKEKNEMENETFIFYLHLFFLFNPISICNCLVGSFSGFHLFTFLFIVSINDKMAFFKTFITGLFCFILPDNIFLYMSYHVYECIINQKYYNIAVSKFIIFAFSYLIKEDFLYVFKFLAFKNDTYPNIGILWGILNETFLKFRTFSIISSVIFTLMINIMSLSLIIGIINDLNNNDNDDKPNKIEKNVVKISEESKNDLIDNIETNNENIKEEIEEKEDPNIIKIEKDNNYFGNESSIQNKIHNVLILLLYISHTICSWYPSEMNIVLIVSLISIVYNEFKSVYLNFSVRYKLIFS